MKPVLALRTALVVLGAGLAGYGGWLFWRQVTWTPDWLVDTGAWLFGGPVLHDALFAPIVAGLGVLIARRAPARWRGTLAAGLTATGVLALISLPLLTRPHPAAPNPGLQNRPYLLGLLVFLVVMWAALVAAHALRSRLRAGRG